MDDAHDLSDQLSGQRVCYLEKLERDDQRHLEDALPRR